MKLPFQAYNPTWETQFEIIKNELQIELALLQPQVEHIGSTSVKGLSAKPVIDVLIGVNNEIELDKVPLLLAGKDYVYYEKYNEDMPYRRFFLKLTDTAAQLGFPGTIHIGEEIPDQLHDHDFRIAHIHVMVLHSRHWLRHIAFRDYLRTHPEVVKEYQALKEHLVKQEWQDGNDYNDAKDAFVKREEQNAVNWYQHNKA
ncbi:GrpB family protein [Polluticaenibacter yanchengensis]|uniref:GrpB family protein n=1 Tax=Polluticaenibacter yanchengensis TaxID=3014562 RepID=A0ABT4UN23_9BACT|nr:GrpB family protein [Chitinophagaceae bacterium LY-5]